MIEDVRLACHDSVPVHGSLFGEHHFFHHLAHDAVGEYDGRRAVFEGKVKTEAYEVG